VYSGGGYKNIRKFGWSGAGKAKVGLSGLRKGIPAFLHACSTTTLPVLSAIGRGTAIGHEGEIVRNLRAEFRVSYLLINKERHANMKLSFLSVGALVLSISATAHAAATGDLSPATAATKFVDALQHQHFKEAAAMFSPGQAQDSLATERTLKRIDENLGGFSTMHPIPTLPDGKSFKLEVPAHRTIVPKIQKFLQVRYASIGSDGQPVFYELNLTADDTPPQVLSFGVHFPASDAQSAARANHLMSLINR
jgi:hypothetical protein